MVKVYRTYSLTTTKKQKNGLLSLSRRLPCNATILSVIGLLPEYSSDPSFYINVLEEKDSSHSLREYTFLAIPFDYAKVYNISLNSYQYIGQVIVPATSSIEYFHAINSVQYFDFFVKK